MRVTPIAIAGLLAATTAACSSPRADGAARVAAESSRATADTTAPSVRFYPVGTRPRAIAVADFDGDARSDVAIANSVDGTITLLFGGADGALGRAATVAVGREPADLRAARIDSGGSVDLVVANHETSHVTVLLNDGRGRFAAAAASPLETGARPHVHSVVAADFDGDGHTDVAVESADTRDVRVLRGGPRGFAAPVAIDVGTMPYTRLGVGGVSAAGTHTILVPGHGDSTVRGIAFAEGTLRLLPWTIRLRAQPWAVAAGDVDGDGREDLAVVESDAVSVWLATAAGYATTPATRVDLRGATEVALGDLDGDGRADVAIGPWEGEFVTVLRDAGRVRETVRACERPIGLGIADMDGDGRAELLAGCATTNRLAVVRPGFRRR